MKSKVDAETQEQITDGEQVDLMLEGRAWGIVHAKLNEKILDLQNINNIDVTDPTTLATQLLGRKLASDLLFAWLKNDVFGFAQQQRENNPLPIEKDKEGFIERHDGE